MNVPLCYRRDKPVGPAKTGFFEAILRRRCASVPALARRAVEREHQGRRATRRATRRIWPPGPGEPPNKVERRPTGPRVRLDDKSRRRKDFVCVRWVPPDLLGGTYRPSAILPAPPLMTAGRILHPGRPTCWRAGGPVTDRAGFEPAVPLTRYAGLANRCLQPLGHLSGLKTHSRPLQRGCQWTCDANRHPFWPARNQPGGKTPDPGVRLMRASSSARTPDPPAGRRLRSSCRCPSST